MFVDVDEEFCEESHAASAKKADANTDTAANLFEFRMLFPPVLTPAMMCSTVRYHVSAKAGEPIACYGIAMLRLYLAMATVLLIAAAPTPRAHIDHVIIAVPDLDAAIPAFEARTGVRPVIGGSHPGRGTRNALVSLGPATYLEIIAPDPAQQLESDELKAMKALARPSPYGWAISGADPEALRAAVRAKLSPDQPGSRRKPDGSLLEWSTFGFEEIAGDSAPFFIHWKDMALHPSRTSSVGCRLTSLKIARPDPAPLRQALSQLRLPITITKATKARMRLALTCPKGPIAFD